MRQAEVAKLAEMRGAQLSLLETGANVEVQFYERVARALGFRNSLEMFISGGDAQTRKLLKFWRALPDDEARNDALALMRDQIVGDEESTSTSFATRPADSRQERKRRDN